jgi:hypothetical protein
MEHDELVFVTVKVICETQNCENSNIELVIEVVENSTVICGVCGIVIENVNLETKAE